MKTIAEFLIETPALSDADALAAYRAQPAEGVRTPIQTVRSWLSANMLATPLRAFAASGVNAQACGFVAEFMDGLLFAESFDGTDARIRGAAEQVVPMLVGAGVMTDGQAVELLAFVRVEPAGTLADVAAARLAIAKDARLVALETFASGYRAAVAMADTIDALPPEVA